MKALKNYILKTSLILLVVICLIKFSIFITILFDLPKAVCPDGCQMQSGKYEGLFKIILFIVPTIIYFITNNLILSLKTLNIKNKDTLELINKYSTISLIRYYAVMMIVNLVIKIVVGIVFGGLIYAPEILLIAIDIIISGLLFYIFKNKKLFYATLFSIISLILLIFPFLIFVPYLILLDDNSNVYNSIIESIKKSVYLVKKHIFKCIFFNTFMTFSFIVFYIPSIVVAFNIVASFIYFICMILSLFLASCFINLVPKILEKEVKLDIL